MSTLRVFLRVRRPALYGLILTVATAFFVMSVCLYSNSTDNLALIDETYSTIALMELYGETDNLGQLVLPEATDSSQYRAVFVSGYPLEDILSASCVTGSDLRAYCGAYVAGSPVMKRLEGQVGTAAGNQDILRFTVVGDQPIMIPISWNEDYPGFSQNIQLQVSETAAGCYDYVRTDFSCGSIRMGYDEESRRFYAEQVQLLNRSDETDYVILYPGVEYLAGTWMDSGWHTTEKSNGKLVGNRRFSPQFSDYFSRNFHIYYGTNELVEADHGADADEPFPIVRVEDLESDPALKARWEGAWEAAKYNTCAYTVCLTEDVSGVPVFHLSGASLADGRMITQEEYDSGAKVCMVSKQLATLQGWYVGKKLDMSLFAFEAFAHSNSSYWFDRPVYHEGTGGFLDTGEYEIVGIYDQRKVTGNSTISKNALNLAWNTIFVPNGAVSTSLPEEELPVHSSLLTIRLENGSISEFLDHVEALGITTDRPGEYTASFTFYDQGYSVIRPSLQRMYSTARLLLLLSGILLLISSVLLSWFFARMQRHNVGIFRMLGGRKRNAAAGVLICALLISFLGAAAGGLCGGTLGRLLGQRLLSDGLDGGAAETEFRAYLVSEQAAANGLSITVRSGLTLLSGGVSLLLFFGCVLLFLNLYLHKEPRALLPQSKA